MPRPLAPASLLVLCLLAGCTHTRHLATGDLTPETRRRLAHGGRPVTLILADGTHRPARDLVVGADSTAWTDAAGVRHTVATASVRGIRYRRRASGALEGVFLGALTGLAGGFGVLLFGDRQDLATEGVATLMPAGAGLGLVAGLLRGTRERYTLRLPAPAPLPPPVVAAPARVPGDTMRAVPPPILADTLAETPPAAAPADFPGDTMRAVPPPVMADTTAETPPAAAPAGVPNDTLRAVPPPVMADTLAAAPGLPTPADTLAAAPETPSEATPAAGWYLVVASFGDADEAAAGRERMAARLGVNVEVLRYELASGVRYRVAAGPFETRAAAQARRNALADRIPADAWLLRYTPRP